MPVLRSKVPIAHSRTCFSRAAAFQAMRTSGNHLSIFRSDMSDCGRMIQEQALRGETKAMAANSWALKSGVNASLALLR